MHPNQQTKLPGEPLISTNYLPAGCSPPPRNKDTYSQAANPIKTATRAVKYQPPAIIAAIPTGSRTIATNNRLTSMAFLAFDLSCCETVASLALVIFLDRFQQFLAGEIRPESGGED